MHGVYLLLELNWVIYGEFLIYLLKVSQLHLKFLIICDQFLSLERSLVNVSLASLNKLIKVKNALL
jgi:hypothetical protein